MQPEASPLAHLLAPGPTLELAGNMPMQSFTMYGGESQYPQWGGDGVLTAFIRFSLNELELGSILKAERKHMHGHC